jgi:hypothetical protein
MLKLALILLVFALGQAGCSIEEGGGAYEPFPLTEETRQRLEVMKRDFLRIEDIRLGDGPLAAWNRKISADFEVRYTDGTVAYRGSIYDYVAFHGVIMREPAEIHDRLISVYGIRLGINGMAVGGKRRFTIQPKLVCGGGSDPAHANCMLTPPDEHWNRKKAVYVRNETLIVEATLTGSCIPRIFRFLRIGSDYLIESVIGCRDADRPQRNPSDSIWYLY